MDGLNAMVVRWGVQVSNSLASRLRFTSGVKQVRFLCIFLGDLTGLARGVVL